ncbi:hypothetical protein RND81_09G195100 [Saponaria officinalis]|uniref:Transmembrane protein n=1 Tax=Saponaria officinalis TaxID=3572 RepID=A0AAW1IQ07_SAPOF
MASTKKKKTTQQRPKSNWFLACFGISSKTVSHKKPNKSDGRKRWFKPCMSKIKITIFRKKMVSFDAKKVATTQSMIMVETTKVQKLKIKHASINREPIVQPPKKSTNDQYELQCRKDESDVATCSEQESTPKVVNKCSKDNKVTKDSLTGLSIMVMTLIIMSFWGRICAILCMSALLYCVPILRALKDNRPNNIGNIIFDVASKLYKKNLVLEDRLQRDEKTGIGVS